MKKLFEITYRNPDTGETVIEEKEFEDSSVISAADWAKDYAYGRANKGPYLVRAKIKVKTSELVDAALDWAVMECEKIPLAEIGYEWYRQASNQYSMEWMLSGPIIDREHIMLGYSECVNPGQTTVLYSTARIFGGNDKYRGPTPLIAAMRCYVASKLGDEIDIPEELLK